MPRRTNFEMTEAEIDRFLEEERIVTCASLGPNGRPHLMPLWYVHDGAVITAWTYGASQKVKNLERLPQATLQVEAGRDQYPQLRGVMMECDVEIFRDLPQVSALGARLATRYYLPGAAPDSPEVRALVARQAGKRVGLRFRPTRTVSWDFRKL